LTRDAPTLSLKCYDLHFLHDRAAHHAALFARRPPALRRLAGRRPFFAVRGFLAIDNVTNAFAGRPDLL
jgi:hypothetical protein